LLLLSWRAFTMALRLVTSPFNPQITLCVRLSTSYFKCVQNCKHSFIACLSAILSWFGWLDLQLIKRMVFMKTLNWWLQRWNLTL
jgi:hypothetical protein